MAHESHVFLVAEISAPPPLPILRAAAQPGLQAQSLQGDRALRGLLLQLHMLQVQQVGA